MPSVAASRPDAATFFRREEGEEGKRHPANDGDAGHREENNATRFQRVVIFVKIVAHFKRFEGIEIMVRVKVGQVVDQRVVDVVNALVDRIVEEIEGVVALIDGGGVATNRFAVAACVFDAFVKDGDGVDGAEVGAKNEGAGDREERSDGKEPPRFARN